MPLLAPFPSSQLIDGSASFRAWRRAATQCPPLPPPPPPSTPVRATRPISRALPDSPLAPTPRRTPPIADDDAASAASAEACEEVSAAEAAALASSGAATLLDLRTRSHHCESRPAGAVSLPAGEPGTLGLLFRFRHDFAAEVSERFDLSTPLVLLCDLGVISRVAAARLAANGHSSVRIVSGGFEAWTMDELPTEEGRPSGAEFADVVMESELRAAAMAEAAAERAAAQAAAEDAMAEGLDELLEGEGFEEVGADFEDATGDFDEAAFLMQQQQHAHAEHLAGGVPYAPWSNADGTPCALQPMPLGALFDDSGTPIGASLDDEEFLEFGDEEGAPLSAEELRGLLGDDAEDETIHASPPPPKPKRAPPPPPPAFDTANNALAGDDLDDTLSSMVAELDAPVRAPGGSPFPSTLSPDRIKSPDRRNKVKKEKKEGPRRRRSKDGIPPPWLVDVSHVDFAAMAQDGRLSKLSVKELKSYLYHTDASLSGNKKELTERVAEYVSGGGGDGGDAGAGGGGGGADGGGGAGGAPGGAGAGGAGGAAVGGSSAAGMGYVNGASTQGVNGAAMNAAESDEELAHLSSLPPPPSAGDDVSPALFNPNAGNAAANNAADDFLIDEVFSSM